MRKTLSIFFIAATFVACKKQSTISNPLEDNLPTLSIRDSKLYVAKTLAAAVEKEPALRQFLKDEALKQFDHDYDVFFQSVKDQSFADGDTFQKKLEKYATSADTLKASLTKLPLLTFLVPELGTFTATNWDATTDIPVVAVEPESYDTKESIKGFYGKSDRFDIPYGSVPATTTIVVKDNDRVVVQSQNVTYAKSVAKNVVMSISDRSGDKSSDTFLSTGGMNFSFADPVFKNDHKSKSIAPVVMGRRDSTGTPSQPDPGNVLTTTTSKIQHIVDAVHSGDEWQRDYIYYGLSANAGVLQGALKRNIRECVTHMRFIDPKVYNNIGINPGDPTPVDNTDIAQQWTNGSYEFRFTALINNKSGSGADLNNTFFVSPNELFVLGYKLGGHVVGDGGGKAPLQQPFIQAVKTYEFPNPLVIAGWDLENVSISWKIYLIKFNNQATTSETVTTTNTYAANFEFSPSLGDKVKTGFKLGSTATTQNTNTYVVNRTFTSSDFGNAILNYYDPIFTSFPTREFQGKTTYQPYEVFLGSVYLTIQPRPVF